MWGNSLKNSEKEWKHHILLFILLSSKISLFLAEKIRRIPNCVFYAYTYNLKASSIAGKFYKYNVFNIFCL